MCQITIPRKKSERFSLTIKDNPYPSGSYLGLSEPDQELYTKGLKYYTYYYKWLTNPKNGNISGILMAFHRLVTFFIINTNKKTSNNTAKFFMKFDLKDWLKITPKPYINFAHIKGKNLVRKILNYWEICTKLTGLRNAIRIPYLDRLAKELKHTHYINEKLNNPDLPEHVKPLYNNHHLRR